jgi:hypothetical protein
MGNNGHGWEGAQVATAAQDPSGADPVEDPAERFASGLRTLRGSAGSPTYRQMAARTGHSPSALSDAAKGRRLPALDVALAYVEACGGDRAEWERRWWAAKAGLAAASTPAPEHAGRRRWALVAAGGAVALALSAAGAILANGPGHEPPPDTADRSPRFFAPADAFNQRHQHPHPAPDSARMVADLLASGQVEVYSGTAGLPVYRAASGTPTYAITPRGHVGQWGPDPFDGVAFPWDPSWKTPPADREWVAVITPDGRSVECLRIQVHDGRPSCEWGAVSDTRGSSVSVKGLATGSGLSRLAGLITRDDWKAGRIDHALSFGAPNNGSQHVFPAVGSDGRGQGRWSEGQFVWLDPAYDIDADTSLRPYERMIAKALQQYGAFDVKNAGRFSFPSEYGSKPPGGDDAYLPLTDIKFAAYLQVGTIPPVP